MKTAIDPSGCTRLLVTRPVMIITTRHASGVLNAGVFGSYTNVSPTKIAVAIGRGSHTYANVKRSREMVINVPPIELAPMIETFAEPLPPTESEVDAAGCHALASLEIDTPGIDECVACVECRYVDEVDVGYHSLVIVEAAAGQVDEDVLTPEGRVDVLKARLFHSVAYPDPIYARFGEVFRAS